MSELSNPQSALATREPQAFSLEAAAQAVMDGKLTNEGLTVMERLLAISAEQQFAAAFVRLQADLPTIVASTTIPNRGKYEKFEDVMKQIQPALTKNGFTVSFSQDFRENRLIVTCYVKHGTHTVPNAYGVRAGKADSETQADCKASTTARRNALLQALNIVIRQDCLMDEQGDASLAGAAIPSAKAAELRSRVTACGADAAKFLAFAQAESFEDIGTAALAGLEKMLRAKEATRKPATDLGEERKF